MFYIDRAQVLVDGGLPSGPEQGDPGAHPPTVEVEQLKDFLMHRASPADTSHPADESHPELV